MTTKVLTAKSKKFLSSDGHKNLNQTSFSARREKYEPDSTTMTKVENNLNDVNDNCSNGDFCTRKMTNVCEYSNKVDKGRRSWNMTRESN